MLVNHRSAYGCAYGCCREGHTTAARKRERRTIKRRERNAWKRDVR